jgi:hypothetical protein
MKQYKFLCGALGVLLFVPHLASAQSECVAGESVTASSIFSAANRVCCSKRGTKQRRCLTQAVRDVNRASSIITESIANSAIAQLNELQNSSCSQEQSFDQACTADISTTTLEATAVVEENSCNKQLRSKRQSSLKRNKRVLRKARRFLSREFVRSVSRDINSLQRSKQCGRGGEEKNSGSSRCSRVVNPRDGAVVGNIYKLGDHDGKPVFITHNGARSGQALTPNGGFIENLRYTGTANPDPRGNRHHYRLGSSCRSLPSGFLIKLGSTCYEINSPCSRID